MELIGSRLRIRHLELDDLKHLVELESDPDVIWFANSPELISSLQTSHALKNIILSYRVTKFGIWAIEEQKTGEFLGTIALLPLMKNQSVEIGYRIRKMFREQGFATEAVALVIQHFLISHEIKKVIATVHPKNLASQKVLTKLGFNYLGEVGQGFGKSDQHETVCWFELTQDSLSKASDVV